MGDDRLYYERALNHLYLECVHFRTHVIFMFYNGYPGLNGLKVRLNQVQHCIF